MSATDTAVHRKPWGTWMTLTRLMAVLSVEKESTYVLATMMTVTQNLKHCCKVCPTMWRLSTVRPFHLLVLPASRRPQNQDTIAVLMRFNVRPHQTVVLQWPFPQHPLPSSSQALQVNRRHCCTTSRDITLDGLSQTVHSHQHHFPSNLTTHPQGHTQHSLQCAQPPPLVQDPPPSLEPKCNTSQMTLQYLLFSHPAHSTRECMEQPSQWMRSAMEPSPAALPIF